MNLVIELYIILCVALLLFDIAFLVIKNRKNYEFYPRNTEFEKQIKAEIALRQETGAFSPEFARQLDQALCVTRNLITLQTELEANPSVEGWFRESVFRQLENYRKKTDYEQAYYTYVVSTFDYRSAPVCADFAGRFLVFLDSKSLYTFCNAMNALYRFGEIHLLLTALDKVDERGKFYHKKLLVDGLLDSSADLQQLGTQLLQRFDHYGSHLRESLLDVFRMSGFRADELCARLMRDPDEEDQVRYCAMRYFIKWPSEQSRAFFLSILTDEEAVWVEQMLSIQALSRYSDEEACRVIRERVTSRHWYVRTNAVDFLCRHGLSRADLTELLELRDKYASEALLYQYREDEETTGFILETLERIRQEDEQNASLPGDPVPAGAV